MKKIMSLVSLFAFLLTISCGGDSVDEVSNKIILEKTKVTISEGRKATVAIKSGNGGYNLISNDKSIAIAKVSKNGVIEVEALKKGRTQIKVSDSKNESALISVEVIEKIESLKINALKVNIGVNKTAEIRFLEKGSGDYIFTSSDLNTATVKLSKGKIILEGVSVGEATVEVKDKKTNVVQKIEVAVREVVDFSISQEHFIDYQGEKEIRIYNGAQTESGNNDFRSKSIDIKGSGVYKVYTKEGGQFVTAKIENSKLIVKSTDAHRAFGVAVLEVVDDALKQKQVIKVRTVLPLDINKKSISVDVKKDSEYITFSKYSVTCKLCVTDHIDIKAENPSILVVNRGQYNLLRGFNISGKDAGTTSIIVSDGVQEFKIKTDVLQNVLLPVETGGIVLTNNKTLELSVNESMEFNIKADGDFDITYENDFVKEFRFEKGVDGSKLILKAGPKLGVCSVKIIDKVTKKQIVFSINVIEGEVFNCDENGNFVHKISYNEDVHHDNIPVSVKGDFAPKKTNGFYECKETITMKVGAKIDINLCGGSKNHRFSVYDQEGLNGYNKREVVQIFNSKVKVRTTSSITALQPGELIVSISAYNEDSSHPITYYKIIVIEKD